MVANQGCKKCRLQYTSDADERNYLLYENYGFITEDKFKKHNAGNKNCPCKQSPIINQVSITNELPLWPEYIETTELISVGDYCYNQQISKLTLDNHNEGGDTLWFDTSETAACGILSSLLDRSIQWITLVAEPGSGKTMVLHLLIYLISLLPYDKSILPGSITLTTGMSDTEWYSQLLNNFKLRNGKYLWDEINKVAENYCIIHRSNFHKRITYLLNNPKYLSNHIFLIDESHFADDPDMTIDKEFRRLGLTEERMNIYNIKVVFVSATPDVNLSLMSHKNNHTLIQLINGEYYKGFKYYDDNNMIRDYNVNSDIISIIRSRYSNPRYHYIRARTQQEKGEYRIQLKGECIINGWLMIEDDSDNDYYLSFKKDDNERFSETSGKNIIRTYNPPPVHTIILIKNKYQASKRLKLTPHTGLISEKPSKKMNSSVTCNGLVPRFFGHEVEPEYFNNELPLFLCDKKSVNEYIKFSQDFIYEGKDYTSSRIKSDPTKTKELKNTCYGNFANITPKIHDSQIGISEPFDSTTNIGEYLREDCGFRAGGIHVRDLDFNISHRVNGYIFPKRNIPGHTWDNPNDTFLIKDIYIQKFVNKGQGSNINRRGISATGQCFVVYPVYDSILSSCNDVKYYVHYLILN